VFLDESAGFKGNVVKLGVGWLGETSIVLIASKVYVDNQPHNQNPHRPNIK